MTAPDTTDPSPTPEPPAAEPNPDTADTTDSPDAGKEAAKYRRRARDAEAERDALAERLTTLQRAEVERLASQHLADGADIWRDGSDIAALLSETGDIDPDKVTILATELGTAHPHWGKRAPAAPPASTVTANGKIGDGPEPRSWTDVLQRKAGVE